MTLMASQGMLVANEDERRQALTHRGMAHFAGTGPALETCGSCQWFQTSRSPLAGKCHKVPLRSTKSAQKGAEPYPASTPACKYHAARKDKK